MMRAGAQEKDFLKDAMLPEVHTGSPFGPVGVAGRDAEGASWRFRDGSFKQYSLSVIQQTDFSRAMSDH
jgi:hypothetical protein